VTQVDVDCRGVLCPRPIIELARAMAQAEVGDTVAVTADDPAARIDVEAWCRMRAQEYVGQEVAPDGVPTYVVRRVS
jgi:tRNA 2-thiouridine synthesizing protein A